MAVKAQRVKVFIHHRFEYYRGSKRYVVDSGTISILVGVQERTLIIQHNFNVRVGPLLFQFRGRSKSYGVDPALLSILVVGAYFTMGPSGG